MKLIVGLGNPGKAYLNNRHNVGFRCIDHFARLNRILLTKRQQRAKVGIGEVVEKKVVLAKPRTFMNLSGQSVSRLVRYFGVPLEDLLLIHDDLDLPLGKVRIRLRGGSAGHRGVESIIASLGSQDFPRIRVGIGRPDGDETAYVLTDFSAEERELVEEAISKVADAIYCILSEGIEAAMNRYN
ncbi:MAG: aminoacyl-tRNA hydrolase [Dehalococcoidia bacterium]